MDACLRMIVRSMSVSLPRFRMIASGIAFLHVDELLSLRAREKELHFSKSRYSDWSISAQCASTHIGSVIADDKSSFS